MGYKLGIRAAIAASVLLVPACATVTRGPNVDFHVATEPPGASVTTDLRSVETIEEQRKQRRLVKRGYQDEEKPVDVIVRGCEPTPCSIEVDRSSGFTVTVLKDGYHPATVEITSGFGQKGGENAAAGTVVVATGAYVTTYSFVSTAATLFSLGSASGAGVAASTASSAATGVGAAVLAVDLASGAMLDVRPNPLVLVLVPDTEPFPKNTGTIIEDPEELEAILKKTNAQPAEETADPS